MAESATVGPAQHDNGDLLDQLTREIVDLADPMLAPIAGALGRAAFRRRSSIELGHGGVAAVAERIVAAARAICDRQPTDVSVRVWQPDEGGCIVDVITEDGPFLVSTLTQELTRRGLEVADVLHPVLGVVRVDDGTVTEIVPARRADRRESWIHVRLVDRLDEAQRADLTRAVETVMRHAKQVTADFRPLTDRVQQMAAEAETDGATRYPHREADEVAALLTWLLDDHFIFLGARDVTAGPEGRPVVDEGSVLGLWALPGDEQPAEPDGAGAPATGAPATGNGVVAGDAPGGAQDTGDAAGTGGVTGSWEGGARPERLLTVSRTAARSTVHRNERMLQLSLVQVEDGEVTGERQLIGLLSQRAIAQPATSVPVLRTRLRDILEAEDVVDHSHEDRAFRQLFEAVPKDELFTMSTPEIRTLLVDFLESQKRQAVRLVIKREPQAVSALITMPRERFNADLRRSIQRLLVRRFGAEGVDYRLSLTEGDNALLHFALTTPDERDVRLDELQRELVEMSRTWLDRLHDAVGSVSAADPGTDLGDLVARWGPAMPTTYTTVTPPREAIADLVELDQLSPPGDSVRVRMRHTGDGHAEIKLFTWGSGIELSSVLPMLESLGLVAVEEVPHVVAVPGHVAHDGGSPRVHIHAVQVRTSDRAGAPGAHHLQADDAADRVSAALRAIWDERAESDSLNRLVLLAGLGWREVGVLRAYRRLRRQVGTSFTEAYQNDALCRYPAVARGLVALFEARFQPDTAGGDGSDGPRDADTRVEQVEAARRRVREAIEEVGQLDHDRILRGFLRLVDATLRTNRYMEPARAWLSLKLDSAQVPDTPPPVPWCEIFVYSPHMEGVHLRAGPVARGGLRWSDRLEDVRTEVLGLMKAQVTKNSMIVPTGSKGGFVLKNRPPAPEALRDEVQAQYEVFIRGLLDLTDNVVDDHIAHPDRVVAPDGNDAYLVVAADRGTATFSDLANRISQEYGYWLGDAFASGGSRGYDHKEMGITARGAWVVVQRHFHELDIDVQTEPVTIAGIGDMSGDVFGNGLLLSRAVKLVAAFDHRDVFIDPDPDSEASFRERERLFHTARSTWQDYDRAALSPGGGVWARTAKSIPLSEEIRGLLRVDATAMTPPELVRAVLRAPTDLLFAAGVGTFVKSTAESNDDVGDRTNDAVRVDATQVGARVVGEGANLALTQRGRIEYARRGGRVNLDAIDNAAGVATSDAEVNIKILLQLARERGEIGPDERDELLGDVRDRVAAHVLHRVWRQAWAISRELAASPVGMESYDQLLVDLEEAGRIDRRVDVLPSSDEIQRRREAGAGLTRPELGTLLGASKRDLIARLLGSDVPDAPTLRPLLVDAFPDALAERFDHLLGGHRLRREIVATELAGDMVDRMGTTYVSRTAHERGSLAAEVAAAYWVTRQVTDAHEVWTAIDELEGLVVPALQADLTTEVDEFVDACVRAYLRELHTLDIAELIDSDRRAYADLERYMRELRGTHAVEHARRVARWTDLGVEPELAERVTALQELKLAPDVAVVARRLGADAHTVADAFIAVTDRLPLDDLHDRLENATPVGRWERWQLRGLVDELRDLRRQVATAALSQADGDGRTAVEQFLDARQTVLRRVGSLVQRMEQQPDNRLAAVTVVVSALRGVLD